MIKANTAKLPHFIRGESAPKIPQIINILKKEGFVDPSINGDRWMIDIEKIKQSLKSSYYRGVVLKFSFQLKITSADSVEIIDSEILNPINDTNKARLDNIIKKSQLIKNITWQTLTDALSINKNISSIDQTIILDLDGFLDIDHLWILLNRIHDQTQRQDRIRRQIRITENRKMRLNRDEERYNQSSFLGEIHELEKELSNISEELSSLHDEVLKLEAVINFQDIDKKIELFLNQEIVDMGILAEIFIPSFYQRINVIDTFSVKKNELLDTLNEGRNKKEKLSEKFLNGAIVIVCILIFINIFSYLGKQEISLSPSNFIQNFLGHGIYFFFIEFICISVAVVSFVQFRMYSKIVEIYDTYIFIVNSDSNYKDDEHFHSDDIDGAKRLFDLRKENTQKIHALPEKTFSLLCGTKMSDDIPQIKIIEEFIDLIKKIKE